MADQNDNLNSSVGSRFRANLVSLESSRRSLPTNSRIVGTPNPADSVTISLHLRRAVGTSAGSETSDSSDEPMDRTAYGQQFGASPEDIQTVRDFAAEYGLSVDEVSAERRIVKVSGTLQQLSQAFQPTLHDAEIGGERYRIREGVLSIPSELSSIVVAVLGFDDRPIAQPHFRRKKPPVFQIPAGSFKATDVAALYSFPIIEQGNANPQCIALIELGGGYKPADLASYFETIGVAEPHVVSVGVGGGSNQPNGDPNSADSEVCLDIEIAGAVAPHASIAVYFAQNTSQGFIDAISTAIHDSKNKPTILSISWGSPESNYTAQTVTVFEEALEDAAALGIPIFAAAGDNGSYDVAGAAASAPAQVDYPASSPNAISCGGTRLKQPSGGWQETVWNDLALGEGATGGGISKDFPLPAWQDGKKVINGGVSSALAVRGVPDVSGNADPETGYFTVTDGQGGVVGGTSAVAPLWAGLTAVLFHNLGKPVMDFSKVLYTQVTAEAFHDITSGSNGAFDAGQGWDACSGLGTPIGNVLQTQLQTILASQSASRRPKSKSIEGKTQ